MDAATCELLKVPGCPGVSDAPNPSPAPVAAGSSGTLYLTFSRPIPVSARDAIAALFAAFTVGPPALSADGTTLALPLATKSAGDIATVSAALNGALGAVGGVLSGLGAEVVAGTLATANSVLSEIRVQVDNGKASASTSSGPSGIWLLLFGIVAIGIFDSL